MRFFPTSALTRASPLARNNRISASQLSTTNVTLKLRSRISGADGFFSPENVYAGPSTRRCLLCVGHFNKVPQQCFNGLFMPSAPGAIHFEDNNNIGVLEIPAVTVRYSSSLSGNSNQKIISLAESGELSQAEAILDSLEASASSENNKDLLPDIDSYTALMNSYLKRQINILTENQWSDGENEASVDRKTSSILTLAGKVHDLLIQMEDLSGVSDHYPPMSASGIIRSGPRHAGLRPTSHHYDTAIMAFANASKGITSTRTINAPYIAQRWLQRMETLAFDPHSGVTPTVDSYYHVMEAFAASGSSHKLCQASFLTQSIFDKLKHNTNLHPTAREYRLLMRTWCSSSSKDAAYKATGIWMAMKNSFESGVEEMEPTLDDGKMILEAWANAVNKQSARRSQNVLSAMQKLFTSKKSDVKPDLDCYRYVLIAMSQSKIPDVGDNIPSLFKSMDDDQIFPDTKSFDAALKTLKNCSIHPKATDPMHYSKMTESMLEQMEKMVDRSSVSIIKPSAVSYTHVIQALGVMNTKKAAVKADALLTKMEVEYAKGDELMKPTRDSYVGTIHAYANSDSPFSYRNANEVLQRMIIQYLGGNELSRPDVCSYHAVIKACAASANKNSPNGKEALLLAISTVKNMKKSDSFHPNSKSYLLLVQCCTKLLPVGGDREKALRSVFRSCCQGGLVDQKVLSAFQSAVTSETYYQEVVKNAPSYMGEKTLPESWTRNLGYRVRMQQSKGGMRSPVISVNGTVVASTAYNDYRMRRRWSKKNQKLLQGGRSS
mmetsp:Transcript_14425/g.30278  ORF Transcript_14425/g.30278 Transcript_14425/m.30278 type:complete len:777 (-) Transcript_14425:48-2378(-)